MSNIVLGIHIGHDRGCSIVVDGVLIGSIAQERLDRVKYSESPEIPYQSIDELLKYHHISISEVDVIGLTFSSMLYKNDIVNYYSDLLYKHYKNYDINFKVIYIDHHLAHASCVYHTSPFTDKNTAILIADGGGDFFNDQTQAESLYLIEDQNIILKEQRLQSLPIGSLQKTQNYIYPIMNDYWLNKNISIARKYEQITYMLGFGFGQCGKTMGLASYGKKRDLYKCCSKNGFNFRLSFGDLLREMYEEQINEGKSYFDYLSENQADLASTVQNLIEDIVIDLVEYIRDKYGKHQICLSGGLFLNCMLNHKILDHISDIEVFLTPTCGDDGQSIGAAFEAYKKISDIPISRHSALPYLGFSYSDENILNSINRKGLSYTYFDNDEEILDQLCELLFKKKIIGFFRGRSEIGPRALCHRSIIADPTFPDMKDYINERVKHREWFRPFAPVVIEDEQYKIFDLKQDSPFMLFATSVKDQYKNIIPSVTHVDGTARIQSISKRNNPFFYKLLQKFKEKRGVPVLLNTSFNDNNQPIVETPDDAIFTFLNTNIDALVMENYLITK